MNLWHEVSLGDNVPNEINVIIEIPKGSHNKYEIDKDTGLIKLDRANYSDASYPVDYGFAPQTLWDDGDALDVIVLSTYPIPPGILVNVRPVALMEMTDGGDSDHKVIGVPVDDKRWDSTTEIGNINEHTLKEIQHFFETYKVLKGKSNEVTVHGFKDKAAAVEAIEKSIKLYNEKFVK
ncbi:inorganic diphosphatase [Candidatus Parcubacteria bacterium]|nr:inorganic diphosphatase [Candidatus Parcubacteria bacterium]